MTLLQLKYAVTAAETKNLTEAANRLFISQPSLTSAIKELEHEIGIEIFGRTNKGIVITRDGETFLGYARQVLEQMKLLEEAYQNENVVKHEFSVSAQHYSFVVNAFVDIMKEIESAEYDVSLRETRTYEIIEDVASLKSEIGVLYLNDFNEKVMLKIIKSHKLDFHELCTVKPHVFVSRKHPLAKKKTIKMEELLEYPYLSFEQGENNSFYFSEEIFSSLQRSKNIRVRDRATLFNLLVGLDGYTVCSGIYDEELNGEQIVSIPLDREGDMRIGYICSKNSRLSKLGARFVESLKTHLL